MLTLTPRTRMRLAVLVAVALQSTLAVLISLPRLRTQPPGSPARVEDTDIYDRYASMASAGKVPYRDFLVEYPPVALPLFLAPRAFARTLAGYKLAFAVEMLLFNAATVWVVAAQVEKAEGPGRVRLRLAWYTLVVLLLSRFVVSRYDAAPTLFGFAAAVWWASGRNRLGGLTAAIGTLLKYYPAIVAAFFCSSELAHPARSRCRGTFVFVLTLVLGLGGWLSLAGSRGVIRSLDYHIGRGLEYGSLFSGAQMLAAKAVGAELVVARDHASYSSRTPWSPLLTALVFPTQVAALVLVWLVFLRRGMRDPVRYSGAAILAFIVTGKVFSPQFLIWLMPYLAVLHGPIARRGRAIFAAGCVATLLAPSGTPYFPRTSLWVILPYNIKNALFLWLLMVLVLGPAGARVESGRDDADQPASGSS